MMALVRTQGGFLFVGNNWPGACVENDVSSLRGRCLLFRLKCSKDIVQSAAVEESGVVYLRSTGGSFDMRLGGIRFEHLQAVVTLTMDVDSAIRGVLQSRNWCRLQNIGIFSDDLAQGIERFEYS